MNYYIDDRDKELLCDALECLHEHIVTGTFLGKRYTWPENEVDSLFQAFENSGKKMTDAEEIRKDITEKAEALATATDDYLDLENRRVYEKIEAIKRIMAEPNELTGKAHSYSSAESVVNMDDAYMNYLDRCRRAQVDQLLARGRYEAARIAGLVTAADPAHA